MKSLLLLGVVLASAISANAATISVSAGGVSPNGIVARSAGGTVLSTAGNYIAVGSYAGAGAGVAPTILAGDPQSMRDAVTGFQVFSSAVTATGGTFVANFTTTPSALDAAKWDNKQIYFLIGNGTTYENSTEFAIFTTTANTLFPADTTAAANVSITMSTLATIVPVTNGGTEVDNASGRDNIQLVAVAPVPEPSTMLLGALGALGLLRRRR